MSHNYNLNGFLEVRIPIIDQDFTCSGGKTPAQVAEFFCELFSYKLGYSCKVINHELQIEDLG